MIQYLKSNDLYIKFMYSYLETLKFISIQHTYSVLHNKALHLYFKTTENHQKNIKEIDFSRNTIYYYY